MRVYAALADRLLVIDCERQDEGVSIESIGETLRDRRLQCVAASSARPTCAFIGTANSGLYRLTETETSRVDSFESPHVTAVTVSPHDPQTVWAGTEPSAVYRSSDGGSSWRRCEGLTDLPSASKWSFPPRPQTHHVRWLSVAPHEPERLYIAIEAGGFVRTRDGGKTWEDHPHGARRDNHTLATHPDAPERIYTAAGDGYAESADGGETWTHPQDGLDHRYVWGLAVDTGDPETVVVSAASSAHTAHRDMNSYIYRKSNGRWMRAMDGLPGSEGTARAVLTAGQPGEFFALTNRGLFYSEDSAHSWERLDVSVSDPGRGLAVVG